MDNRINFRITDWGNARCLRCGNEYHGFDRGGLFGYPSESCLRCGSPERVEIFACTCCGNEYPESELNDGLCDECYLDFDDEDPALRHLAQKKDLTDVLRLRARREEVYA